GSGAQHGAVEYIILSSRIPQMLTAIIAGAALAASGLLLQTAFRNPLAGPSVLGINSGASLGVAVVILLFGGSVSAGAMSWSGYAAVMAGAFAGSLAVIGVLLALSAVIRSDLMLLIVGVMIGYLASSLIMLLNYTSTADGIQSYVMWGMGNFSGVTSSSLPMFALIAGVGIMLSLLLVKPLNIVQLGADYASSLGVNLGRVRNMLLLATGLLSSSVTAFCGPIAFIGLAMPHVARMIFRTADHRVLLPATLVVGAAVALLCNMICVLPAHMVLPLNAVTPVVGVPVILYVILRRGRRS
ncbi:MAG: iron ABC transporter permease, partial [Paramuribaculum sp.]|nr:iron ABC transporter permease [Paramuribaculum sp.]